MGRHMTGLNGNKHIKEHEMDSFIDFMKLTLFEIPVYRYFIALLIILLAVLLQKLFFKVIKKIISKIFIKINIKLEDSALQVMGKPVKMLFFIVGLWMASLFLSLPADINVFINRIIRSLFIFLIFWSAYRFMDALLDFLQKRSLRTGSKSDYMLFPFIFKGIKVVLAIVGLVLIIQEWNYNITTLLTGLGLGGLALALAAKDTLANLFGSIMIMIDRPFFIGDWILTSSAEGVVEEIGFRSTKIRTFSQALVSIPNSTLSNEPITNWSRMGKRRISFRLGLVYKTSADRIREFVKQSREMLESNKAISSEPVHVYFDEFGKDALEVLFYFYTNTTDWKEYLQIKEQINLQIMDMLKEMEISVAYTSRSIYIENENSTNK